MRCPICQKSFIGTPGEGGYPFCSARCRMVDLGNWLDGSYSVPISSGGLSTVEELEELERLAEAEADFKN